jgi:hypothetical protein
MGSRFCRRLHRTAGPFAFLIYIGCGTIPASAQAQIKWEVANRFRLFAEQAQFDRHVEGGRATAGGWKSILDAERALAANSAGRGWATEIGALCYDSQRGQVPGNCRRDGTLENYLNPQSSRIKLTAALPAAFTGAQCTWTLGTGSSAKTIQRPCNAAVDDQRVSNKGPTAVHLEARNPAGQIAQADITVAPRDILVVGMGDSIAAGEGNPDRPITLSDDGFCFRRFLSSETFYLPGRADAGVIDDCSSGPTDRELWDKKAAGWLYAACHRSLYSYQTRAALALAIENPALSVTFIPLGCTGASIPEGLTGSQEARERPARNGRIGPRDVESQFSQLANYLGAIKGKPPFRRPDVIFLTIGANDIGFSGLVADVLVNVQSERSILDAAGLTTTPVQAKKDLVEDLKDDFKELRRQLLPYTGGSLKQVIFVRYGNPATRNGGEACPASRQGVDAHPAFAIDGAKLRKAVEFVDETFLPMLAGYVKCGAAAGCKDPAREAMSFVDGHKTAFGDHGFCATSVHDPLFDQDCFRNGDSFNGVRSGLTDPLFCRGHRPAAFRPYAERARWIRTVNDSYFSAMTYPAMKTFANPIDIHDGLWGLTSVVYGGAMHPTAEGHAAMADATLKAATDLLHIVPAAGVAASP